MKLPSKTPWKYGSSMSRGAATLSVFKLVNIHIIHMAR